MIVVATRVEAHRGRGHILIEPDRPARLRTFRVVVTSLRFRTALDLRALVSPRAEAQNRQSALQKLPAAIKIILARCQRILQENEFTEEEWTSFTTTMRSGRRVNSIRFWLRERGHRHSPPSTIRAKINL